MPKKPEAVKIFLFPFLSLFSGFQFHVVQLIATEYVRFFLLRKCCKCKLKVKPNRTHNLEDNSYVLKKINSEKYFSSSYEITGLVNSPLACIFPLPNMDICSIPKLGGRRKCWGRKWCEPWSWRSSEPASAFVNCPVAELQPLGTKAIFRLEASHCLRSGFGSSFRLNRDSIVKEGLGASLVAEHELVPWSRERQLSHEHFRPFQ